MDHGREQLVGFLPLHNVIRCLRWWRNWMVNVQSRIMRVWITTEPIGRRLQWRCDWKHLLIPTDLRVRHSYE